MKKICMALLIMFSFSIIAFADEYSDLFNDLSSDSDTSSDVKEEKAIDNFTGDKDFRLKLLGDHSFCFHIPVIKDHINFDGYIKSPKFKNDIGIEIDYKIIKFVSHWQLDLVLNEVNNWNATWDGIDFKAGMFNIRPLENFISINPWKFNLSFGFQEFNWGTGDGLNPTDNLNPKDYSKGVQLSKITTLSAAVSFYPIDFISMEVVYLPYKQASKFPYDLVGMIPNELFTKMDLQWVSGNPIDPTTWVTTPKNVSTPRDVEKKTKPFDWSSLVIGGKLNFFFRYVDFSFSYIYDIDPFLTPEINLVSDTMTLYDVGMPGNNVPIPYYRVVSLDLVNRRLHRFGADIKANAGRFGLWAEVCYTMTEDYLMNNYQLRNHNLSWVAGFDFSYGPNDDFYFNLQYTGEFRPLFDQDFFNDYEDGKPDQKKFDNKDYIEEYYYRSLTNILGGVSEGLLQGLFINMKWPVLDSLIAPSITAGYFLPLLYDYDEEKRFGSLFLKPEIDIMPIDSLHILIGADLYFSWYQPKDSDNAQLKYTDNLGTFYKDSNIYLIVSYKWDYQFTK